MLLKHFKYELNRWQPGPELLKPKMFQQIVRFNYSTPAEFFPYLLRFTNFYIFFDDCLTILDCELPRDSRLSRTS